MTLRLLPSSDRRSAATAKCGIAVVESQSADRLLISREWCGDRGQVRFIGPLKSGTTIQEYQKRDILQFREGNQQALPNSEPAVLATAAGETKRLASQSNKTDGDVWRIPAPKMLPQPVPHELDSFDGQPLVTGGTSADKRRPKRARAATIQKGLIQTMSLSTRKPAPLNVPPLRKRCEICGEPSYSLSGEHPQCAQKRADAIIKAAVFAGGQVVVPKRLRLDWHYRKRNQAGAPVVPPACAP